MERPTLPARCLPFPSLLRLKARTFAVLCPVRFCGHRAFTVCPLLWTPRFYCLPGFVDTLLFTFCPLLWTPRFYCLSTFVDTALLPSVRFCGHRAFTACPLLWTPCFYCLSGFVDTTLLPSVHFCGHRALTACPVLWTPRFYRLSGFVDTSHTRQRKIPVLWNFYSVSLVTILCCFNSRVKWYLTWVVITYYFNSRVS